MKISGYVFDQNNLPMKGVIVSDGMNFAKTDANGAFSLSGWKKANGGVSGNAELRSREG